MDFERSEMKLSQAARTNLRNAVAAEFAAPQKSPATKRTIRDLLSLKIPAYQIAAVILVLGVIAGVKNWGVAAQKVATPSAPLNATSVSTVDGANEGAHNVNFL